MAKDAKQKREPLIDVLDWVEPDGYQRGFCANPNVRITFINELDHPRNPDLAEHATELLLAPHLRKLFRADYQRGEGLVQKIKPSKMLEARRMAQAIIELNRLKSEAR